MPEAILPLVYIVGLFFAIVGYAFARGALATWTHSIGYLLEWLANHADIHVTVLHKGVTIPFGKPFREIQDVVVTALQNWCAGAEIEMGYFMHGLEQLWRYTAESIDLLARETGQTFDWLVHVRLPRWAKVLGAAAFPLAWVTKLIVDQVRKAIPHLRTEIHTVVHDVPRTVVKVLRQSVGGAVALPGWVLRLPHRLHGIDELEARLAKRLHKVEGLLGATVMAVAMANVLGVSARCLRRGNVGKTARRLCGLSTSALNDLLSLLADVLIISEICEVLPYLENGFNLIAGPLTDLIGEAGAALCGGDFDAPPDLAIPVLSMPALVGVASVAA